MRDSEPRTPIPSIDWPRVWEMHGSWLKSVLRARLRSRDEVDEVFQEVALSVARKPCNWPNPEKVAPWLYRVAIQHVWLFRRKRIQSQHRHFQTQSEFDLAARQRDPAALLMELEDSRRVQNALSKLCGQDREMLLLKHAQQWTYDQICNHTGISKDKVIYRIGRARKRLKAALSEENKGQQ